MTPLTNVEVIETEPLAAQRAANFIAEEAKSAVAARGRFVMGVSISHASFLMLRALATADVPWPDIHIVQVDECDAPRGHPDRKLTHLHDSLLNHSPLTAGQIHAIPVDGGHLDAAAAKYAATLQEISGTPPTLDLIQLCLGKDGDTASLFAGDAAMNVCDGDVAVTSDHDTRRRLTLTYPMINRSRQILWVITEDWKAGILKRLLDGDEEIPASRVRRDRALVIVQQAIAEGITHGQNPIGIRKAA